MHQNNFYVTFFLDDAFTADFRDFGLFGAEVFLDDGNVEFGSVFVVDQIVSIELFGVFKVF